MRVVVRWLGPVVVLCSLSGAALGAEQFAFNFDWQTCG
jgi:hypothetical protein